MTKKDYIAIAAAIKQNRGVSQDVCNVLDELALCISVGHFKVRERILYHNSTKARNGLAGQWTEYQVWEGRRIVARHDILHHALEDANTRLEKHKSLAP